MPAVWIPAFFDPSQYLNALRMRRSRAENIPARMLKNTFEVLDFDDPSFDNCPVETNVAYLHGVWLEGASWDRETRLLVEQTNSAIYDKFPVIRVKTEMMTQKELDALDGSLSDFEDNPPLSKKDIKEKEIEDEKIKEQMEREDKLRSQLRQDQSKSKLKEKEKRDGGGLSRASALGRSQLGRMNSRASIRES